jgi:hypothetical protein
VNQLQGAQRFEQLQLGAVKVAELLIAVHQHAELAGAL